MEVGGRSIWARSGYASSREAPFKDGPRHFSMRPHHNGQRDPRLLT